MKMVVVLVVTVTLNQSLMMIKGIVEAVAAVVARRNKGRMLMMVQNLDNQKRAKTSTWVIILIWII